MRKIIYLLLALAAMVSCEKSGEQPNSYGEGQMSFTASVEGAIELLTRSGQFEIPEALIPSQDEMSLRITGSYTDSDGVEQSLNLYYASLDDYHTADVDDDGNPTLPYLAANGSYSVMISDNRDASIESADNPCFSGAVDFEVEARGVGSKEVSMSMHNSAVRLYTDETFRNYFPGGATLSLSTSDGAVVNYTFDGVDESIDDPLYVVAGTTLTISGEAIKQPTTESVDSGTVTTFDATAIGTTTAGAMTTVTLTADGYGSAVITVVVDGEVKVLYEEEIELN